MKQDNLNKIQYYDRISKRMKNLYFFLNMVQKRVLLQYFERKETKKMLRKIKFELKQLIPDIPYIGGKSNTFTKFMIMTSILLPTAKVLKEENVTTRQIGHILYQIIERSYSKIPKFMSVKAGKNVFKEEQKQEWKEVSAISQKKEYEFDWVSEYVEGDGEEFQYGLNMHECGAVKFWKKQGLEEFVPYLCLSDWITWQRSNVIASRTQTIASGADYCDFRYLRNGKTDVKVWPPESLNEWTGKFERPSKEE